jgi:hypothetical protein
VGRRRTACSRIPSSAPIQPRARQGPPPTGGAARHDGETPELRRQVARRTLPERGGQALRAARRPAHLRRNLRAARNELRMAIYHDGNTNRELEERLEAIDMALYRWATDAPARRVPTRGFSRARPRRGRPNGAARSLARANREPQGEPGPADPGTRTVAPAGGPRQGRDGGGCCGLPPARLGPRGSSSTPDRAPRRAPAGRSPLTPFAALGPAPRSDRTAILRVFLASAPRSDKTPRPLSAHASNRPTRGLIRIP